MIEAGPGVRLVVREAGHGPAVVMIPSWARGASDFDDLALRIAAAGWRAVAVNPRGIEGSEGPLDAMTTWTNADDVAAVIRALGAAPAFVLGHAGGNRTARALATRRPELVRGVILLAAGGKHREAGRLELFAGETLYAEPAPGRFIEVMHESGFFAPASDPAVWFEGWWRPTARPQSKANQAVDPALWWAGGGKPILVVQGLDDRIAPVQNGRDLAGQYPDRVSLVELADAAHALLPEQPQAVAREVLAWLQTRR
jgi:pimeloyl-ACP methyl ester carboxylesterase